MKRNRDISQLLEGRHAALVCLSVAACLLAGPAPAQPPAETLLSLVCWQNQGEKLAGSPDLLEGFQEANPGLRVNLSYDRWPQAFPRLEYWTGSLRQYAPDLTVVKDVWLPRFADDVMPLDDLLPAARLQGITPSVLERCRVNGKLLGVPWLASARVLYYRSDLLEAAKLKPPQTLEELAQAAKALGGKGVFGLGLPAQPGGGGVDAFLGLLWALGGQAVADGRVALKTAEAAEALQWWTELQRAGALEPEGLSWSSAELDEAFAEGKLAMVFSGPALGRYLRRERPALKFQTVPLPAGKTQPGQVSVDVLVALSSSKHPQDAARFMAYMASENAQRAMWLMGGLPTHRRGLAEARQDPAQRAFVERLETAQGMPVRQLDKVQRVVERALWLALSGRAEPAAALKTALTEEEQPPF